MVRDSNCALVVWPGTVRGHYGDYYDTVSEALEAVLDAELTDGSQPTYVLELWPAGPKMLDVDAELEDWRRDARADYAHRHATRAA